MTCIVSIFKNQSPSYYAYRRPGPVSEGACLMLTCMGLHWFPALQCWTNAPDDWREEQVQILLNQHDRRRF
ncbi:hypothetical protein A9Q89_00365 [Gammaproteobacteria bacterium 53_120_T64]|nr:hypothetical protein A9Q89_00365 [Gammaproteobacteria bacterium 53_120_T64]